MTAEPLRYHEVELKYELPNRRAFRRALEWMDAFACLPAAVSFTTVKGTDRYYRQGRNVVRHRLDSNQNTNQLTVKRRTSKNSTVNREEIDLDFSAATTPADVTALLLATGWKRDVMLTKTSYILKLRSMSESRITETIALYTVDCQGHEQPRRFFFEVEVEKDSTISEARAETLLEKWKQRITEALPTSRQQNLSLYELYSGNRYSLVPDKEQV